MIATPKIRVLTVSLHNQRVGYLVGYQGKNVFTFTHDFIADKNRPTFGLTVRADFPNADKILAEQWVHHQRLNPLFSNLLPEGGLRSLIAQSLKIHPDNEFEMIGHLGQDLPGALIVEPADIDSLPNYILGDKPHQHPEVVPFIESLKRFSLAGVQMKFSMRQLSMRPHGERFTLPYPNSASTQETPLENALGNWIIKTPSITHKAVPQNEYSMMTLAQKAGIAIPAIKLVNMSQLDNLPQLNLPDETLVYAIERFDRQQSSNIDELQRVHTEDFAQILMKYPHDKYRGGNYEQIGRILYQFSNDGLADVQQFARRLLVNILLGNGDAHLKNWSVMYADKVNLKLSPAYDIVFTKAYIADEANFALNLAKTKDWYRVNFSHFELWAKRADIPYRSIKPHLDDVLDIARTQWRQELESLPMLEYQKTLLRQHWQGLQADFRI